jgi:hypothetical protein
VAIALGGGLWFYNAGTIQGISVSIITQFLLDDQARTAYFAKDGPALHGRLHQLGVEMKIKAFYRPQIQDEVELDRYIHQLFYDSTGYVGKSYKVVDGRLILLTTGERLFPQWFSLAFRLGLVVDSREERGAWYVTKSSGEEVAYEQMVMEYPLKKLRSLVRQRQKS